jgi:hypothetical protein
LSTRVNLHAKHIVDDEQCQRCAAPIEDCHHVFFSCLASSQLWMTIGYAIFPRSLVLTSGTRASPRTGREDLALRAANHSLTFGGH